VSGVEYVDRGALCTGALCRSLSLEYFGSLVRPHRTGGESSFAVKREYHSVITHRHTRVMIREIRWGIGGIGGGGILRRCFRFFLFKVFFVRAVLFYLLSFF